MKATIQTLEDVQKQYVKAQVNRQKATTLTAWLACSNEIDSLKTRLEGIHQSLHIQSIAQVVQDDIPNV